VLARLGVAVILSLPFMIMNLAVHSNSFQASEASRYLVLILDRFIPSIGAAFVIFGLTDIVCVKLLKFYTMEKRQSTEDQT